MGKPLKIAPSIIAADFSRLADAAKASERGGADWLHVDVMDGRFVPNITVGPGVVKALGAVCHLPLDVHLMIEEPDAYLEAFFRAGSRILTVHIEACRHLNRTLRVIRTIGMKAGVAINPSTPVGSVVHVLDHVDVLNIMTVNPGFSGQKFLREMLPKIREAKAMIDAHSRQNAERPTLGVPAGRKGQGILIEVDGGITLATGRMSVQAGADILVAGASVFGAGVAHVRGSISQLKKISRYF